jgi:hypothetical protein
MYYKGQTLRHKVNNTLARLFEGDIDDGSIWHWGNLPNGEAFFIAEDGTRFKAKRDDYTHIEDALGRACIGYLKEGEHVATDLKKYLGSKEEMAAMREQKLLEWEASVLSEMEEDQEVRCPFADGSESIVFRKWFLERRGAIPLHKSYDRISAKHQDDAFPNSRDSLFFHQGRFWIHACQLSKLAVTQVDHLKEVAAMVEEHSA